MNIVRILAIILLISLPVLAFELPNAPDERTIPYSCKSVGMHDKPVICTIRDFDWKWMMWTLQKQERQIHDLGLVCGGVKRTEGRS